jgi:hypothetical protein
MSERPLKLVYSAPGNATRTVSTETVASGTEPNRQREDDGDVTTKQIGTRYRSDIDRDPRRPRRGPSILDLAFERLAAAIAAENRPVERSNLFDEWRELLSRQAAVAATASIEARQILGLVLAATLRKDVTDFSDEALGALQAATNVLRRPRSALLDVKAVTRYLADMGIVTTIPVDVSTLSESQEEDLDAYLERLMAHQT